MSGPPAPPPSAFSCSQPPPLPPRRQFSSAIVEEERAEKKEVGEDCCFYNRAEWELNEKLFPRLISCLKSAKNGKPFVYYMSQGQGNSGWFGTEKIRVPTKGLLRAYRGGGRLKLNLVLGEEEEDEVEMEMEHGKMHGHQAADHEMETIELMDS